MGADDVGENFDFLVRCAGYDGEEREELATRVAEMLLSSEPEKVGEGVLLIWRVAEEISAANVPF
jgi:hypothetical protein